MVVAVGVGPRVASAQDKPAPNGPTTTQAPPVPGAAEASFGTGPVGAASAVTGGSDRNVVVVRSLANEGRGSLREAASREGATVVFSVSGSLMLRSPIEVGSNVTIDGRGADVTLVGKGLEIAGDNVVIRNLKLRGDSNSDSNDDAIAVQGSTGVWIDHVDLTGFKDGLIDLTREATNATVSWSKLHEHAKTALLGAADAKGSPELVDVTVHHNLFFRTGERNPLMRHGRFHAFNNVVDQWGYDAQSGYGMRAGCGAVALVEANTFIVKENPRALTIDNDKCDEGRDPALRLVANDLGGLEPVEANPSMVPDIPADGGSVEPVSPALTARVESLAGWQRVASVVSASNETTPTNPNDPSDPTPPPAGETTETSWTALTWALATGVVVGGSVVATRALRRRRRPIPAHRR